MSESPVTLVPELAETEPAAAEPAGTVDPAPVITVTKGSPDEAELAALTAVVMALVSAEPEPEQTHHTPRHWVRRAQLHVAPKPGPGAWRRSA